MAKIAVNIIIFICVVIAFGTVYNLLFQTSATTDNTTAFPNPIFKHLDWDVGDRIWLIVIVIAIGLVLGRLVLPRL